MQELGRIRTRRAELAAPEAESNRKTAARGARLCVGAEQLVHK
jgi:hypothetical protein